MRYGKLMLGTMVMASLFGLAACSQSSTGLTGTAGDQSTGETVGDILAGMKSSERVDVKALETASDLSAFKDFLAAKCPAEAGCDYEAALILYLQRTRQQEAAGIFPATFPQVETVTKAYEEMTGDVTVPDPDVPEGPAGGGSGASGQNPVDGLIDQISSDGGDVSIDKIEEMLTQRDAATAAATLAAIKAALAGVQPRSDIRPTAELLLKGQTVPSAEAVLVLKAIASNVNLGGRAGVRTGPGQPGGSDTVGMRALTPVVAALVGAMASQQVSWADIEELITKADPSGAASLADKVEAELKNMPQTSPNVDTAEAIVTGLEVLGSDAGATLLEIMKNGR